MSTKRNKTSTPLALTVAAILGISGSAIAGDGRPEYSEGHQRIVYGKVIDVTPMYRQVRVTTPVKECWSEPVTRSHRVYDGGHTAGSTLAGGIIGGIIGHQIGKGRGRKLATAVGTIVGAQMGHDAAHGGYATDSYIVYEDVCEVEQKVSYEQVLDGYQVNYKYQGSQYQTVLPYNPGNKIKLRLSVEPVF